MDYENTNTKSFSEMQIEHAQGWLQERAYFWSSSESTPEIDEWQLKMHEINDIYYSKSEIYEMLDSITTVMARMYCNLGGLSMDELSDAECNINEILNAPCENPIYDEVFDMANAKICIATSGKVGCIAENILNMLGSVKFVFEKKPTKRVMQAFHNALRSRVLEQEAACLSHCRTALELELKEIVSEEMLIRHLGPKRTKYAKYYLSDYIIVAAKEGLLNENTKILANNVKERANKICHDDTSLTQKVFSVFDETCHVICTLCTGKDPIASIFDDPKLKI